MKNDLEKKVMRKVTLRIIPFIMLLYFIAFLDRVNIGFAALTMNQDLGFSPTVFGLGAGIFFLGYFLFEVPSNLILHKVGARIWIARVMITWGFVSGCMAFVQGTTSFYILRFLLGVAEAGFFPGIILYLSYWFPAARRAQVTAIFMAAAPLSTALGSPVSSALLEMHGFLGYAGWQWMFVLEALPALVLGVVVLFFLTDRPAKAKWLTDQERAWLENAMQDEERARAAKQSHSSAWRGLADIRVLALALVYFGTSAGLYTLGIWSPQIIRSFGASSLEIGFLNAFPAVIGVIAMILWARHSDRTKERSWHVIGACLLAAAGLIYAGNVSTLFTVMVALTLVTVGISASKPQVTMRHYKIAAIPADGIGPEVISAGIEVLHALTRHDPQLKFDIETFDWGSDYYKKHGVMMPEEGLNMLKAFDAIYFGAVGAPDVPDHITLWGLRLPICQGFDQYANVRPTKILPGVTSPLRNRGPGDLDWVIVRENSEGEYSGNGGRTHRGLPEEVGTEVAIFTRVGVTRIMRYAFRLAQSRPRKLLTVVTKSNAQRHGMVMWDEIAAEVAQEFPDVQWDKMLVDAMTHRMTLHPQTLDTIVATNLHADILSDLAGALAGSLGVAPTANIDPERRFPSMFEPIHGSAFDITGKGIANPIATFWTAVQMLEHLGERHAAALIMESIEYVCEKGILTPDVGGSANTAEVTRAVVHYIDAKADIAETA